MSIIRSEDMDDKTSEVFEAITTLSETNEQYENIPWYF